MATWHHFAEKFPLLKGKEMEALEESLIATKGNKEHPVTYRLVKGKREYLDGRNRWIACEKHGLKCHCRAVNVKDDEVKAYIIRQNITRRHMDEELRKSLVAELREDGKSVRQIAETLQIPKSTVHRDIESVPNGTPEKSAKNTAKSEVIFCDTCKRRQRVGQALPGRCAECSAIRKADKEGNQDADVDEPVAKATPMDEEGNEVPKNLRDAFAGNRKTIEDVRKILFEAKRMLKGLETWNPFVLKNSTVEAIDNAIENLKNGLPHIVCPDCAGKGKCKTCRNSGWLPKWAAASEEAKK